ncbi:MAG: C4-dicarboxylate TRAP transporter large permease protein DctM [Alphaproteobacteria bacterium MarineAlpha9_Bin5]|nr:MAG: C4-dicarboxylate TRAP transporter large permease protein DctM [Alphaproteobacteria bacterium MarineAlpha9_Bin5]
MSGLFLEELFVIGMVLTLCGGLLMGFPVAFTLSGVALLAALLGNAFNIFELVFVAALPNRMYGIMTNDLLIAVPLFIFMGVMLERSKLAEELLETIALLLSGVRAGLGIAVTLVGGLLAASTGIVGATVVTMGLLSLPTMLRRGYAATVACGSICAAGTLGQIIPPSIVLILLGDQISAAYQQAQLAKGNFAPEPVSVADLFVGALLPGLGLVLLYIIWQFVYATIYPEKMPSIPAEERAKIRRGEMMGRVVRVLLPPLFLIVLVLGSILVGLATPTEAAGVGAMGAMLLAATRGQLTRKNLTDVMQTTAKITAMVFVILIGAQLFSLVFRGFGGDDMVAELLESLPGGVFTAMFLTMALIFFLGFFLDFIEICFVVIPIVGPAILAMDVNPVWFAIMIAVNVQTSFLTPPFGFSLFYLRGVAPPEVTTMDIYRGVVPFVFIQLGMLCILALIPELATWLPKVVYG